MDRIEYQQTKHACEMVDFKRDKRAADNLVVFFERYENGDCFKIVWQTIEKVSYRELSVTKISLEDFNEIER